MKVCNLSSESMMINHRHTASLDFGRFTVLQRTGFWVQIKHSVHIRHNELTILSTTCKTQLIEFSRNLRKIILAEGEAD